MQPLPQAEPTAKARWLRIAAASSFAALSVCLAIHQLVSAAKDRVTPASASLLPGQMTGPRTRMPAPEFWLRDHAAGREQAQATGKPIFLVIRCEP